MKTSSLGCASNVSAAKPAQARCGGCLCYKNLSESTFPAHCEAATYKEQKDYKDHKELKKLE